MTGAEHSLTILARGPALTLYAQSLAAVCAHNGRAVICINADWPERVVTQAAAQADTLLTIDLHPALDAPEHRPPAARLFTCLPTAPPISLISQHLGEGPTLLFERIPKAAAQSKTVGGIIFPPLPLVDPDPVNPFNHCPSIGLGLVSPPLAHSQCRRMQQQYLSAAKRDSMLQIFLPAPDLPEICSRLGSVRAWLAPPPDGGGRFAPGLELLTLAGNGGALYSMGIPADLPGVHAVDDPFKIEGPARGHDRPEPNWRRDLWERCAAECWAEFRKQGVV